MGAANPAIGKPPKKTEIPRRPDSAFFGDEKKSLAAPVILAFIAATHLFH
jgi:hypothetical protein